MSDVNIEVLNGGLGVTNGSGADLHVVVGTCELGADLSIVQTTDPAKLATSRGRGAAIVAAAICLALGAGTVLFVKAPTVTAGHVQGDDATPVAITSSTNATPIVVTTTAAHGLVDGDIVTIAGHTTNTGANGTHKVHVLSATTFSLPGIAGTGAGTGGTVQRKGVTSSVPATASGTSVPTLSGASKDSSHVRWRWVNGGTQGTSGATFQLSLNGGLDYGPVLQMGTASSYVIDELGITVGWSAGTFVAGEYFAFKTIGPKTDTAGLIAAIRAFKATGIKARLIHIAQPVSGSDVTTLAPVAEELKAGYRYLGFLCHARDASPGETQDAYETSLASDFAGFTSDRVSVAGGYYNIFNPIAARLERRPVSFDVCARLMLRPVQEHPGKVAQGPLASTSQPSATDTVDKALDASLLYIDTDQSPALKNARFLTVRKRVGRPGFFVDQASMMCSPTSDFQTWPLRSVIDIACDSTYEVMVDEVNSDLDTDPKTGFITEVEARGIEAKMSSRYRADLTSKGRCSAVAASVGRADNILSDGTMTAKVRVQPKGYVKTINVTVGYTNPAIATGA